MHTLQNAVGVILSGFMALRPLHSQQQPGQEEGRQNHAVRILRLRGFLLFILHAENHGLLAGPFQQLSGKILIAVQQYHVHLPPVQHSLGFLQVGGHIAGHAGILQGRGYIAHQPFAIA